MSQFKCVGKSVTVTQPMEKVSQAIYIYAVYIHHIVNSESQRGELE